MQITIRMQKTMDVACNETLLLAVLFVHEYVFYYHFRHHVEDQCTQNTIYF